MKYSGTGSSREGNASLNEPQLLNNKVFSLSVLSKSDTAP